jgi:hypothetical protein
LRKYVIGAAVLATALITAAVALAVTQRTYVQTFAAGKTAPATKKPNKPTGSYFKETSNDPANPQNHQPKQDAYVEDIFPKGTTIDQTAAPNCTATDSQLVQNPNGACPAKSKVGTGNAVVSLKFNGALVKATATGYNCKTGCKPPAGSGVPNKNELILFVNPQGSQPIVLRGVFSTKNGVTKLHVNIPITCVLGDCAKNGDARISEFELTINKTIKKTPGKPDKTFVRTPTSCPANHKWRFTILFHGRDGKNQSKPSDAPCTP